MVSRNSTDGGERQLEIEAEQHLASLEKNPRSRAFIPLSEIYRKLGRLEDAVGVCREGLTHYPENSVALVVLGRLFVEQEKWEEAEGVLEKAVALSPENLAGYRELVTVYQATGSHGSEREALKVLLNLNPNDEDARSRLAIVEEGHGDAVAGIGEASESQKVPEIETETLANLYLRQGYLERAAGIYKKLLKLDPQSPALQEKLALCGVQAVEPPGLGDSSQSLVGEVSDELDLFEVPPELLDLEEEGVQQDSPEKLEKLLDRVRERKKK